MSILNHRLGELMEQGTPVLTPTLRMARSLRSEWVALSGCPVITGAPIFVLGGWLEQRWVELVEAGVVAPKRVLSSLEAEELWLGVIEQSSLGQKDFTLVTPAAAARAAHLCRETLLQHGGDTAKYQTHFSADPDCQQFLEWHMAFEQRLREADLLTPADVEVLVAQQGRQTVESVAVYADQRLTPLSKSALSRVVKHVEYLELGASHRLLMASEYRDPRTEMLAAAHWAADRHRAGEGSTAIVLLDMVGQRDGMERALREAFGALDARYDSLPLNFSRGAAYADTAIYRDMLLALRVLGESCTRADLLALLRSCWINLLGPGSSAAGLRLVRELYRLAVDPIPRQLFREALANINPTPLGALLDRITARRELVGTKSASEWRRLLGEYLDTLGWPARVELDSFEFQLVERFDEVMDTLELALSVHGDVTYHETLTVLARLLKRRQFQPHTEPGAIQILSDREIRGLGFDAIWLLGAQSDRLPAKPALLPFIPPGVQRELQMPVAVDPDGVIAATELLDALSARSNELVISWHKFADGVEQLPSPLIQQGREVDHVWRPFDRWRTGAGAGLAIESVTDDMASALSSGDTPVRGGVALLKNQIHCPFRSWLLHRLHVRELDDVATGLTAGERGSLMHAALRLLWTELQSSAGLAVLTKDERAQRIEAAARAALRALPTVVRQRVNAGCLDVEEQRLCQRIESWLEIEESRQVAFSVISLEEEATLELSGIELRVVADRVDELADGRRLVIDYKTGSGFSVSHWWGDAIREPQLPAYALLDPDIQGVAWGIANRKLSSFKVLGVGTGIASADTLARQLRDDDVVEWQDVESRWRDALEEAAQGFVDGDARVAPLAGACQYCSFQSVCRIHAPVDGEGTGQ